VDIIVRTAAVYAFLLVVFRFSGRRTLSEMTTFDLVLLLIISETTQQAMIGDDFSFTAAALAILTFVGMNVALAALKTRFPALDTWLDGLPTVIVADGRPLADRMRRARVDVSDVLAAARELQGLGRLDQIAYAVLERDGKITVIPKPDSAPG
jgi:uncharacterized membrane protein YcaP (DUF421 family)